MANVLNRTTKQYLTSVSTPDYPTGDWIINPDLSATTGEPNKYWVITGDVVSVMKQSEKDTVDAAEEKARLDGVEDEVGTDKTADALLDEINTLRAIESLAAKTVDDLKTAVRSKS